MVNNKLIAVIIPSYNEIKNLSILIGDINKELSGCKIIIVDDSPLKENLKLQKIVRNYKNILLISRFRKEGRGSAVLEGFKVALKNKNIRFVFEMDSDLAHSSKEMARFIKKNKDGNFDLIIGSRYLPGGKIINIAANRTILSRLINKFLHYWLGMHLSDHTSGFRFYNRRSIEHLTNIKIKSSGFIALSEIAYKLYLAKFRISEVPITWNYRIYGKSNVNLKELFNSLSFVILMKLEVFFNKHKIVKVILLSVAIFILALSIRLSTINQMGRAWDEQEYVEQGYRMVELIKEGDLSNKFFYTTYDHPPLIKYLYGLTAQLDLKEIVNNQPVFNYDYTFSRLFSAVLFCLGVLVTTLIGWKIFSPFVGIISGTILSVLPFPLGLSQLVTTESLKIFIYPLAFYSYIFLAKKFSLKRIIAAGIATGIALQAKQTDILLIVLLGIIFLLKYKDQKNKQKKEFRIKALKAFFTICLVAGIVFIAIWPQLIFHFNEIWETNQKLWGMQFSPKIWQITLSPPEIFFGRLMLTPVFYYIVYFFITIPFLILVSFFMGVKYIFKNKNLNHTIILVWFLLPFSLSIYSWRQHGLRYIIEIYPAIALISAVGFNYFVSKITKSEIKKFFYFIPIFLYLLTVLWQIKPYYLDYFNELAGGVNNVYERKLFQIGWWGQGLGEAGYYLRDNAKKNSSIALFISPPHVFPPIKNQKLIFMDPNKGIYRPEIKYDYVVVNYFHVLREGFDDAKIKQDYRLLHRVMVDEASLVDIYSKKN